LFVFLLNVDDILVAITPPLLIAELEEKEEEIDPSFVLLLSSGREKRRRRRRRERKQELQWCVTCYNSRRNDATLFSPSLSLSAARMSAPLANDYSCPLLRPCHYYYSVCVFAQLVIVFDSN